MVLKLDNTDPARRSRASHADLVVEELVEGGITRLAAFYYSDIPGSGPGPLDARQRHRHRLAGRRRVGHHRRGAGRSSGSPTPASGSSTRAARLLPREQERAVQPVHRHVRDGDAGRPGRRERPDDYLPWGAEEDLPQGKPANTLPRRFRAHTTNWTFQSGNYVNQNTYAGDGDEFPADSVLVLRVDVGDAGYRDPAGNPVPETKFEGEGEALLFHAGKVVRALDQGQLGSALKLRPRTAS